MDRARYPREWEAIARRIRDAAGNCCQRCGVPNGAYIVREEGGAWREVGIEQCDALDHDGIKVTRIVLTTAHTGENKHDKMDCSSLESLCQRCHLLEDLDDHVRHAVETRRRKRIAAGQAVLMEEVA
jgi:hypothetical protein